MPGEPAKSEPDFPGRTGTVVPFHRPEAAGQIRNWRWVWGPKSWGNFSERSGVRWWKDWHTAIGCPRPGHHPPTKKIKPSCFALFLLLFPPPPAILSILLL